MPSALELMLLTRHLERIGDHATNIAEDVFFVVAGEDVRHNAHGLAASRIAPGGICRGRATRRYGALPPRRCPRASSASPAAALAAGSRREQAYVFTYFTKNGEDGLHLAWSADGYRWEKLNDGRSYLTPTVGTSKLMRDPCVVRGPDGTFHMVWTSGWNENNIGYASSKDLITWTEQKAIPVMAHEPTVLQLVGAGNRLRRRPPGVPDLLGVDDPRALPADGRIVRGEVQPPHVRHDHEGLRHLHADEALLRSRLQRHRRDLPRHRAAAAG